MTNASPVILIDGSNVGHASLQMATKLYAGETETTGIYGFVQTMRVIKERLPGQAIVLWDGRSWRHDHYSAYKANRDDNPALVEGRARWKEQRALVTKALFTLGIHQVGASNLEADDLARLLGDNYAAQDREVTLVSGDRDWLQLIGPKVSVLDLVRDRFTTNDNFTKLVELPSPFALAQLKALSGDTSDNIPGVGNVGDKTARAILNQFGSVEAFTNACLLDRSIYAEQDWRTRAMADDPAKMETFNANMKLIWLRHPEVPKPQNFKVTKGVFNPRAFAYLCEEWAFTRILRDFDNWIAPFNRKD